MGIPPKLQDPIDRLNQELDETEQETIEGLNIIRQLLANFPDNVILTQFFATFSNTLLFVEISRRRIKITVNRLSSTNVTSPAILEIGEDLSTELGKVLEAKIRIRRLIARLQELS